MNTARTALVDAIGQVVNVVVVDLDGNYAPPQDQTAHVLTDGSMVSAGWTLVDGSFEPPAAEPAGPILPTVMDLQAQIDMLILEQLLG